jgi:hypothetical protein
MKHRLALSLLVLGVLLGWKQQASAYYRLAIEPGFNIEAACNNNSCLFGLFGIKWDPDTGYPTDLQCKKGMAGTSYCPAPAPYYQGGPSHGIPYQPAVPPIPPSPRVPPQAQMPAQPPVAPPQPLPPGQLAPGGHASVPQGWGYPQTRPAQGGYPYQAVPVGYYPYPQPVPQYYPYAVPYYGYGW